MFCTNYVIKRGDTLYSISRQNNVPVSAIIAANPFINIYNLQIGEIICIPVGVPFNDYSSLRTYMIKDGDTLGSILNQNGMSLGDFMELNDVNSIYLQPGTAVEVPDMNNAEDELL